MNCRLIKELKAICDVNPAQPCNRLLLTGTPLQNNLTELWSLLNFLLPSIFDDLESFQARRDRPLRLGPTLATHARTHTHTAGAPRLPRTRTRAPTPRQAWFDFDFKDEGVDDRVMKGEMEQGVVTKLHQILRPFLLRRLKCDVELNIPKKYEYILFGWLSEWQASMYKDLIDKNLKDSDGKAMRAPPPAAPCRTARSPCRAAPPLPRRPPPAAPPCRAASERLVRGRAQACKTCSCSCASAATTRTSSSGRSTRTRGRRRSTRCWCRRRARCSCSTAS